MLPLNKAFVDEIAEFCKTTDILLIVDEVQTGVGRTGTLFCFQQYGIEPDVVTFAKGIAAGLPFGGVLANENCAGTLSAGPSSRLATGSSPRLRAGTLRRLKPNSSRMLTLRAA